MILENITNLIKDLWEWFFGVDVIIVTTIVSLHYIYQYKENNYHTFIVTIRNLFQVRYIYRYFRYTILALLIQLFLSHYKHIINLKSYSTYNYNDYIYDNVYNNIGQYIVLISFISFFIFRIFKNQIQKYLKPDVFEFRRRNKQFTFLKFYSIILTSTFIQFFVLFIFNSLLKLIDRLLINGHYYPIDTNQVFDTSVSYFQGVYISIFLSFIIVFTLLNVIIKSLNARYGLHDFLMYIFVLIIVGFGSYSGFYSIFNYLLNISNFGIDSNWLDNDKLIGNFSIRITSIILFWSILNFAYKSIFSRNFLVHIINAILPVEQSSDSHSKNLGKLTDSYTDFFDLLYFSQVGFYILNVFSAEYLISRLNIDVYSSFLFLILPIIVDDFLAIHVYHKKFNFIDDWHRIKIVGFNILLYSFSTLSLIFEKQYLFLGIYIFLTTILYLNSKGNQRLLKSS